MNTKQDILKKFLSGDDQAYTWVYNTYSPDLFSYGKSLGFDKNILKDTIQDIFFKILCDRKLLAGVENMKFYLFRALRNQLINQNRRINIPSIETTKNEPPFFIKVTILDQLIEEEEREELRNRIENLLNCLTERQREAISLRFIHELEYDEIASILNMTSPAVRNLIARAIKRMRTEKMFLFATWPLIISKFCY